MSGRWTRACVAALLIAAGACADAGPDPEAGVLSASLVSPNGSEGAVLINLVGSGIGTIEASAGRVFQFAQGDTTRALFILDSPGVVAFRVAVPNIHEPPLATVTQVSDGDNGLRPDASAYRVRFDQ